jgi:DNA polymerase III delta subunit
MIRIRLHPFMVYSGTEEYDLDRQISRFREGYKQSRQVILLDGKHTDSSEVVAACEEYSFLDERDRLVILDHAEAVKNTAPIKAYIEAKDPSDLSAVLVAVLRPTVKDERITTANVTGVWAKAAKFYATTFDMARHWDTKAKLVRLNEEAGILGMRLDKGVAEALLTVVGDDLYSLTNELKKLSLLVGEHGTVTLQHVKKVVTQKPPASAFEVADATCEKNVKRAMNLVAHLYRYDGEDKATLTISSALIRNVEHLLVTRAMLDAHKPHEEIVSRLGGNLPFFVWQKKFLAWSNRHTVASLRTNLATLCRLDANIKGPSRSKRTQVELAVLSIAS